MTESSPFAPIGAVAPNDRAAEASSPQRVRFDCLCVAIGHGTESPDAIVARARDYAAFVLGEGNDG